MPLSRPAFLALLFGLLPAFACSDDGATEPDPPLPDPPDQVVYEQLDHDVTYEDAAFDAETVTLFRTTAELPELDVRALRLAGDTAYAGTAAGLFALPPAGSSFAVVAAIPSEPVVDLEPKNGGGLLVATATAVHHLDAGGTLTDTWQLSAAGQAITAVVDLGAAVLVGTDSGLHTLDGAGSTPVAGAALAVRDLSPADSSAVWAATAAGIARYDTGTGELTSPLTAPALLPDDDVRALGLSADGSEVYAATATGLSVIAPDGSSAELCVPDIDSLPSGDLQAVAACGDAIFTGHAIGATVTYPGAPRSFEHYHSLRWIPDERVTAVTCDADGTRWIGTGAGISRISYEPSTLLSKAELFEQFLQERHWRMDGFVDDRISIADEWDLASEIRTGDHDNDGLWTEMQIGAWCYAYAVTADEQYYDAARKAMDVIIMQFDIPGLTFEAAGKKRGFITRSLVRDDEGEVFSSKATQDNWHLQAYEGRQYYWKDDTSSDEYAGHYFGIPIFYDLCAKTEDERAELRERIRLSTDYLIDNGYLLIDLDGQPTTHGHWKDLAIAADGVALCAQTHGAAAVGDCLESRHGGGWLNSLEILGHLLAAWHMTGDRRYYDEYERLYVVERYGDMIPIIDDTYTVTNPAFANHSDHELAMLSYTTLARYEPHADRRERLVQSMLDMYEYEREEHNPWQVAVIGSAHGGDVDLAGAVQTLKDMPTDWRTWTVDNSHRQDAERWPDDRHDNPQFNRVFPYDEIRTMKWNGNPYAVADAGSGQGVLSPTPYQLAYWMLRYHGLIE